MSTMGMETEKQQLAEWRAEFDAAARRPLRTRFRYAFVHTYKPVLDEWCARNLPSWLGYGPAV